MTTSLGIWNWAVPQEFYWGLTSFEPQHRVVLFSHNCFTFTSSNKIQRTARWVRDFNFSWICSVLWTNSSSGSFRSKCVLTYACTLFSLSINIFKSYFSQFQKAFYWSLNDFCSIHFLRVLFKLCLFHIKSIVSSRCISFSWWALKWIAAVICLLTLFWNCSKGVCQAEGLGNSGEQGCIFKVQQRWMWIYFFSFDLEA